MIIEPKCGLCNYLRVIFSYHRLAKERGESLTVVWHKTQDCPGFFLDYFEPVPNIFFLEHDGGNHRDYVGCEILTGYPPNYEELKLLPYMQAKVDGVVATLRDNYIAVHIRRTDHVNLAKSAGRYTDDDAFRAFIDREKQGKSIYIATDNKDTYDAFCRHYPDAIPVPYHATIPGSLRQTSMMDSIVDLYVCVGASAFMGSGYSSFSEMIDALREEFSRSL